MQPLNCASINFGGINTSKLEFADFSNAEVKDFFQRVQTAFEAIKAGSWHVDNSNTDAPVNLALKSLRSFIQDNYKHSLDDGGIDSGVLSFTNYMFDQARGFMLENMDPAFVLELAQATNVNITSENLSTEFDLGAVTLSTFVNMVLMKDKGIGGFDQISSGRPTNIGANLNKFLEFNSVTNTWDFNKELFLYEIKQFYTQGDGISFSRISSLTNYRDIFLKGRKEGPDGKSAKNYYKHYEEDDVRNGDIPNSTKSTAFHLLANIVMMVYDMISMELISRMSPVPSSIPEKPSAEVVTATKAQIVADLILNMTPETEMHVVFLTECVPHAFNRHHDALQSRGYQVHYGPESDGVCNAIIYSVFDGRELLEFTEVPVSEDMYPHSYEFKEVPLHLCTRNGQFHLVSYHANGKGVTVKNSIQNTSFYSWVNALPGCVILGGDLNMDFKKVGDELTAAFELGSPTANGFSCFKQRTPLQAQYDKAGVFDKKYCDFIITRGCRRTGTQVVRTQVTYESDGTDTTTLQRLDCSAAQQIPREDLVVPNAEFPFEHYIVTDVVTPIIKGCDFFRNISSWLVWVDDLVNWAYGN